MVNAYTKSGRGNMAETTIPMEFQQEEEKGEARKQHVQI